jgi:ATP-dependent helicase/nuclease subunit B
VAGRIPTTLYFPFRKDHPAFHFAGPFFEQKLMGHAARPVSRSEAGRCALDAALDGLFDPRSAPVESRGALTVISASGARDECWAAAKEILRLVEDKGLAYEEIGVVARNLEPYRAALEEVFGENAIPLSLASGEPLLRHPLDKCALNLLTLKLKDFPAATVEDLLGSPYLRGAPPRWRSALRDLGIHSGWLQWRGKLAGGDSKDCGPLWDFIRELEAELSQSSGSSWSARAAGALALLSRRLSLPADAGPKELAVWETLQAEISSLAGFDLLGETCGEESFFECLTDKLRRATVDSRATGRGVRALGVMDARGESFRVLFLLGLKEGIFPRTVREDPLLRDGARAALRHPAGYWIAQKAAGHEEERLLFYLAAASAREHLYCVYPRSDESGRALVPSLYLRELCRTAGVDFPADSVRHVPRQPGLKLETLPPALAAPGELSLRLALEGKGLTGRLPDCMGDAGLLDQVLSNAAAIGSWGKPGEWDGMLAPRQATASLVERGLSPSALDSLAACPFQFFARRVLGLDEGKPPCRKSEFPAVLRGEIYHEILERFYRGGGGEADWAARLEACIAQVFSERGWLALGLYPLLWQAAKDAMTQVLREFLAWDVEDSRRSGLKPTRLEERLEGALAPPRPEALAKLRLHGIADRIDRADDGRWRVVDYKTRWTYGANLRRLALAGKLHQLSVYAELAAKLPGHERLQEACIYALEESPEATGRQRVYRYDAAELAEDREAFLQVLAAAVRLIREGRFPILPEDGEFGVCGKCAYAMTCRKSHGPSRARAAAVRAQPEGRV